MGHLIHRKDPQEITIFQGAFIEYKQNDKILSFKTQIGKRGGNFLFGALQVEMVDLVLVYSQEVRLTVNQSLFGDWSSK